MTGRTPAEVEAAAAVLRDLAMPRDRDDYVEWATEQALDAADAAAPPPADEAAVPAAPQWSCGRCDSFAARGFDDGQIPEHHRTCRHAGVGAGPLGDDAAAVLALHQWHPTHGDQCMCGRAPGDWSGLDEGNRVMAAHQLDALRDAGCPVPPVQSASPRSDLTGLGAREAGLTVYPATDARSTDQDVTG